MKGISSNDSLPPSRERPPVVVIAAAAVAAGLFLLPLLGLLIRTPWTRLGSVLTSDTVLDALRISLLSSVTAAVLACILGVPLAWMLSRYEFRGRQALRSIVTLPMVLPPVVGGVALGSVFGRGGFVGGPIESGSGLLLQFSFWGIVLANTFVAMPFLVITTEAALNAVNRRYEAAAATLGASGPRVFTTITIPSIWPGLKAGIVLAWARAFGEFGATLTFNGSLQGRTQTMPLAVFVELSDDTDAAIAIAIIMVAVSLIVLTSLRDRWWNPS